MTRHIIPGGRIIWKKEFKHIMSEKGAKYTKIRRPVELVYYEEFETKEEAMKREYAIKQLKKCKKEELILNWGRSKM